MSIPSKQSNPEKCQSAHLSTLWNKYNIYHNCKTSFKDVDMWHCACKIATPSCKMSWRYAQPKLEVRLCFSPYLGHSTKSRLADFSCPVTNIISLFRIPHVRCLHMFTHGLLLTTGMHAKMEWLVMSMQYLCLSPCFKMAGVQFTTRERICMVMCS